MSECRFTIADHQLLRQISVGSYGEVWLARNSLGTLRAVKIVERSRFDDVRPFKRELDGIRQFEPLSRAHDGLVDILQVGENAEYFYYVMELADAQESGSESNPDCYAPRTLASEIKKRGSLPCDECIQIGIKLCSALSFLHERSLIHRDIKPSNVIFVQNELKLADIGLVAAVRDARTYVGTSGFIPPEGPNSIQADIYGVGKTLYELSSGRDRLEFPALPESASLSNVFLELNQVLLKACETDKNRRYDSASAMAADLQAIASGQSVRRLHQLERQLARIRKSAAVTVLMLIVAGLMAYEVIQHRQRTRDQAALAIGTKVGEGITLWRQGDLLGSLRPLLDALLLDKGEILAPESHRLRIGATLAACPTVQRVWRFHGVPIRSCGLSGQQALMALHREYCQVFDTVTGAPLSPRMGFGTTPEIAEFSPDGTVVVTAGYDERVRVFEPTTARVTFEREFPDNVLCASLRPDGRLLVAGCGNGDVFLVDTQSTNMWKLPGHTSIVRSARFSRKGRFVVTTSYDNTARVWQVETKTLWRSIPHSTWVYSADFSPDEQVLATADNSGQVRLWDLHAAAPIGPPLHHPAAVYAVRFSSDGNHILTACLDGSARIWNRQTHLLTERNHTLRHPARLYDACFGSEGHQILTAATDGTVTLWDFAALPIKPTFLGRTHSVGLHHQAPSPGSPWKIVITTNALEITRRGTTEPFLRLRSDAAYEVLAFDQAERHLAAASNTNIYLADLRDRHVSTITHPTVVTHIHFSNDGSKMVCASTDGGFRALTAQVWDVRTKERIGPPLRHDDGIRYADFDPTGQLVITTGEDSVAKVWSVHSGKLLAVLHHKDKVLHIGFASRRPWAVTSSEDQTAVIWELPSGDQLTPPLVHQKPVRMAEFAEEDTTLIVTDEDGGQWKWVLPIEERTVAELTKVIARLTGSEGRETPD